MTTIRLIALADMLYFPKGGNFGDEPDAPSLLVFLYPAGDADTVPWPMVSEFASQEQLRNRLARALFDERETNPYFPDDAVIELPDGTVFDFDTQLATH